jgi:hypothetical protein
MPENEKTRGTTLQNKTLNPPSVHGVGGGGLPQFKPPGETPYTNIAHSPLLNNWLKSSVEVLGRYFNKDFTDGNKNDHRQSFRKAEQYFQAHLITLNSREEMENFADRIRDRVRKQVYRNEYNEPSQIYTKPEAENLKNGRAPRGDFQLEHLMEVKTKVRTGKDDPWKGQLEYGFPERALNPDNLYFTKGGPKGTAPTGTLHQEKHRLVPPSRPYSPTIREETPKLKDLANKGTVRIKNDGIPMTKIENTARQNTISSKPILKGNRLTSSKTTSSKPFNVVVNQSQNTVKIDWDKIAGVAEKAVNVANVGLEVWNAIRTIDDTVTNIQEARMGGSIAPEIKQAISLVEAKYPDVQSMWTQIFARGHEDKKYPIALQWLNKHGTDALLLKDRELLDIMGQHLSSIGWYMTYLFELERKCQEYSRKIDPLKLAVEKRTKILSEITDYFNRLASIYVAFESLQPQLVGLYFTFSDAHKDMNKLEFKVNDIQNSYKIWSEDLRRRGKEAYERYDEWDQSYKTAKKAVKVP